MKITTEEPANQIRKSLTSAAGLQKDYDETRLPTAAILS
jgi:hypothetical protein